jgi:mono/diheme cytochrome c family protein
MMRIAVAIAGLVLATLFIACEQNPQVSSSSTGLMTQRNYDAAVLAAGQTTYLEHCAQCHGHQAEGDPQWRKPGPDGKYPPPPLNGSGHTWHHSRAVLRNVIKNGSPQGQGNMPAWEGKLSEQQIEQVIDYFQSLWPEPVYAAWIEMQQTQR